MSGYRFVRWRDVSGKTLSETPSYAFTVSGDAKVTAEYEAVAGKKKRKRRKKAGD